MRNRQILLNGLEEVPSLLRLRGWLSGKCSNDCVSPLGQRTDALIFTAEGVILPRPKKSSFECCERNPEPACRYLVWRFARLNGNRGADGVAIDFVPAQSKCNSVANFRHRIVKDADLGRVTILEDDFEAPIVIDVSECKGAAVVGKSRPAIPDTSENVPSPLLR